MAGALDETRYAYERGRYGYLEWVEAQREFIAIRRSLIEAAVNAQVFQAEIERLTGEPLAAQP
jgi:cobalt-zinc-cadmium efflux system outer membrane protein